MSDFLGRLVARDRGGEARVEPLIAPRFAPGAELAEPSLNGPWPAAAAADPSVPERASERAELLVPREANPSLSEAGPAALEPLGDGAGSVSTSRATRAHEHPAVTLAAPPAENSHPSARAPEHTAMAPLRSLGLNSKPETPGMAPPPWLERPAVPETVDTGTTLRPRELPQRSNSVLADGVPSVAARVPSRSQPTAVRHNSSRHLRSDRTQLVAARPAKMGPPSRDDPSAESTDPPATHHERSVSHAFASPEAHTAHEPSPIHVTIGRVEVWASPPMRPMPPARRASEPTTLEAYLNRRPRGGG